MGHGQVPTERFSDRVENYIKYRPGYPEGVMDFLKAEVGFRSGHDVADIGAGTGIFSALLLEAGLHVHALEPNREMRQAAERRFRGTNYYRSLEGTAESTGLADHSVDWITAAQAFHWFQIEDAKREFRRILRPEGRVVLVWNERREKGNPFSEAYEALLCDYANDYREVSAKSTLALDAFKTFFIPSTYGTFACTNSQVFDREGLVGRALSSSYAPQEGIPNIPLSPGA